MDGQEMDLAGHRELSNVIGVPQPYTRMYTYILLALYGNLNMRGLYV